MTTAFNFFRSARVYQVWWPLYCWTFEVVNFVVICEFPHPPARDIPAIHHLSYFAQLQDCKECCCPTAIYFRAHRFSSKSCGSNEPHMQRENDQCSKLLPLQSPDDQLYSNRNLISSPSTMSQLHHLHHTSSAPLSMLRKFSFLDNKLLPQLINTPIPPLSQD